MLLDAPNPLPPKPVLLEPASPPQHREQANNSPFEVPSASFDKFKDSLDNISADSPKPHKKIQRERDAVKDEFASKISRGFTEFREKNNPAIFDNFALFNRHDLQDFEKEYTAFFEVEKEKLIQREKERVEVVNKEAKEKAEAETPPVPFVIIQPTVVERLSGYGDIDMDFARSLVDQLLELHETEVKKEDYEEALVTYNKLAKEKAEVEDKKRMMKKIEGVLNMEIGKSNYGKEKDKKGQNELQAMLDEVCGGVELIINGIVADDTIPEADRPKVFSEVIGKEQYIDEKFKDLVRDLSRQEDQTLLENLYGYFAADVVGVVIEDLQEIRNARRKAAPIDPLVKKLFPEIATIQLDSKLQDAKEDLKARRAEYVGEEIAQLLQERTKSIDDKIIKEGGLTRGLRNGWKFLGEQNLEKLFKPKYLEKKEDKLLLRDKILRGVLKGISLRTAAVAAFCGVGTLMAGSAGIGMLGVFGTRRMLVGAAAGLTAAEAVGHANAFDPKQVFGPDYAKKQFLDKGDNEKIEALLTSKYDLSNRKEALENLLGDFEATLILRGEKLDEANPFYASILTEIYAMEKQGKEEIFKESDKGERFKNVQKFLEELNFNNGKAIEEKLKNYKGLRSKAFWRAVGISTLVGSAVSGAVAIVNPVGWLTGGGHLAEKASGVSTEGSAEVRGGSGESPIQRNEPRVMDQNRASHERVQNIQESKSSTSENFAAIGHTKEDYIAYSKTWSDKFVRIANKTLETNPKISLEELGQLRNMASWKGTELGKQATDVLKTINEGHLLRGNGIHPKVFEGSKPQNLLSFLHEKGINDPKAIDSYFRGRGIDPEHVKDILIYPKDTIYIQGEGANAKFIFAGESGHPLGYVLKGFNEIHFPDANNPEFKALTKIMSDGAHAKAKADEFIAYLSDNTTNPSHSDFFREYYEGKIGVLTQEMRDVLRGRHSDLLGSDGPKKDAAKAFFKFIYDRHVKEMRTDPWFINAEKVADHAKKVAEAAHAVVITHGGVGGTVPSVQENIIPQEGGATTRAVEYKSGSEVNNITAPSASKLTDTSEDDHAKKLIDVGRQQLKGAQKTITDIMKSYGGAKPETIAPPVTETTPRGLGRSEGLSREPVPTASPVMQEPPPPQTPIVPIESSGSNSEIVAET